MDVSPVVFTVDLLMLQEEYGVKIRQARSGNYLIPNVIPWSCICNFVTNRGTYITGWSNRLTYGVLDSSLTAEKLEQERLRSRTRQNDDAFNARRANMEREEGEGVKRAATGRPDYEPPKKRAE
eukprot:1873325-Amphidinium_carterae.1